jgi:hypothetical protein
MGADFTWALLGGEGRGGEGKGEERKGKERRGRKRRGEKRSYYFDEIWRLIIIISFY